MHEASYESALDPYDSSGGAGGGTYGPSSDALAAGTTVEYGGSAAPTGSNGGGLR